jgi:hypothetical protein
MREIKFRIAMAKAAFNKKHSWPFNNSSKCSVHLCNTFFLPVTFRILSLHIPVLGL